MANIAEGQGRSGSREFHHHLSIAHGSLTEVEAHVIVAHRLQFLGDALLEYVLFQIAETRRPLRGLIRQLRSR